MPKDASHAGLKGKHAVSLRHLQMMSSCLSVSSPVGETTGEAGIGSADVLCMQTPCAASTVEPSRDGGGPRFQCHSSRLLSLQPQGPGTSESRPPWPGRPQPPGGLKADGQACVPDLHGAPQAPLRPGCLCQPDDVTQLDAPHEEASGYTGTSGPRTTLGNGVWWPEGFTKGFEEEATAVLRAVWEVVPGDKVTEDGPRVARGGPRGSVAQGLPAPDSVACPSLSWLQGKAEGPEGDRRVTLVEAGARPGGHRRPPAALPETLALPQTPWPLPVPAHGDEDTTQPSLSRAVAAVGRERRVSEKPAALRQHKHPSCWSGWGRQHLCPQVNGGGGTQQAGPSGARWAGSSSPSAGAGARSYTRGEARPMESGALRCEDQGAAWSAGPLTAELQRKRLWAT
uniref:Uncharacterized protein n=1 Tax=Rangifer tarandus platyrhynchus TaxID=3082113 RepID=A0ACB0E5L5_RANTA|nr:unnamed protein product [Rangifer tarandus platyrhynchus]